ncbi:MAG: HEPN domain-containing protein [bacterium]
MSRLLPDADIDDEIIGFHAQQAVEQSLKAWLIGQHPRPTSSLTSLLRFGILAPLGEDALGESGRIRSPPHME